MSSRCLDCLVAALLAWALGLGAAAQGDAPASGAPARSALRVCGDPDNLPYSHEDAIGVQLIGNDLAATPPGHALAARGATQRVVGYTVYGDGPAAQRMVESLARGELDAALIWGPQAGWFAQRSAVPMRLVQAAPPPGLPVPFEFAIAMGVRRGDKALRDALDGAIERRRADIDAILAEYAVPRTDVATGSASR